MSFLKKSHKSERGELNSLALQLPVLPLQSILLFALAIFLAYFFLSGFIWGAGYYPTPLAEIDPIVRLMELPKGSNFYDLGSGYGRMIIGISQKYAINCVGVEIDPVKCWWTRFAIKQKNLGGLAQVVNSNMFDVDLKDADGVFIFLSKETKIMERLRKKMFREMKQGSKVVSYVHKFRDWEPDKSEGKLSLYSIPASASCSNSEEARGSQSIR